MQKFIRHISLVLLGVFMIPLVLQSVHVHQHHEYEALLNDGHNECLSHVQAEAQPSQAGFSYDDDCDICDFEYANNNGPSKQVLASARQFPEPSVSVYKQTDLFLGLRKVSSLRGPPVVVA